VSGAAADMRRFWDERAREDACYFVDSRLDYRNPDAHRFWRGGEEVVDAILGAVGVSIHPTDVVVDIGCGLGRLSRALAARAGRVLAVDVSSEMIERARELNAHLGNVEWLVGDGESLAGIEDASADAVVSHVVFQHIPDPAITLGYVREMGRVLRPGGWAAFQVSTDPDVHRRRRSLGRRALALLGRAPRGQESPAWLGSAVDLGELRAAAAASGLALESVEDPGSQYCTVLARRTAAAYRVEPTTLAGTPTATA
jgi:SAM-dependent methyltransferase